VPVEATTAHVWELVTDIELPSRLSGELQRVEWLDGATEPVLGACFAGDNHHDALGEWRTTSQVVQLDPERVFAWAVLDSEGHFGEPRTDPSVPMATWRFELEPDNGGTHLRQSARLGPARSGLSQAIDRMPQKEEKLVAHRLAELRAAIEVTLSVIKTLAEQR
jgi:hypothetical protein